jgi:hypothetical protein
MRFCLSFSQNLDAEYLIFIETRYRFPFPVSLPFQDSIFTDVL